MAAPQVLWGHLAGQRFLVYKPSRSHVRTVSIHRTDWRLKQHQSRDNTEDPGTALTVRGP